MPYNNEFVAMSSQLSIKLGGSDYHWQTCVLAKPLPIMDET